MTPIERAARAISTAAHQHKDFAAPWWSEDGEQPADTIPVSEADKALYREQVRAVLAAIRDSFDESGLVKGARQMADMEGSESATRASAIYDGVIDWFDAALGEG